MTRYRIFTPDGSAPYSTNVEATNIETHIAAGDHRSTEAEHLREFMEHESVLPPALGSGPGSVILTDHGTTEDGIPFAEYSGI